MRNRRRLTPTPEDEAVRSLIEGGGEEEASVTLAEVLADSPIAYWPLQGDTPLNDYSGNGRHLTASSGTPPAQTGANFPTNALPMRRYVGDKWDRIAGTAFGVADDGSLTVECWAINDAVVAYRELVYCYDVDDTLFGWYVSMADAPEITAAIEGDGAWNYSISDQAEASWTGSLIHYAAVWNGTVWVQYLNGAALTVAEDTGGVFGAVPPAPFLYVGKHVDGIENAAHDLAHIAIYSTALSGARVLAHYQEVVP